MVESSLTTTLNGVFLNILNVGVLIMGQSGIGKSELALVLIKSGNALIADDSIHITLNSYNQLIGSCHSLLQDFLEVRGLGILNIRKLFGDSAIRPSSELQLIIKMAHFSTQELHDIDRLNGLHRTRQILGMDVPEVTIPVMIGRHLAVLVEAAVRNLLLKQGGYDAGQELRHRHSQHIYSDVL